MQTDIPKPAHLTMPTCEMPPTLHLFRKNIKKTVISKRNSKLFVFNREYFLISNYNVS